MERKVEAEAKENLNEKNEKHDEEGSHTSYIMTSAKPEPIKNRQGNIAYEARADGPNKERYSLR
jgi:hypothetical protein